MKYKMSQSPFELLQFGLNVEGLRVMFWDEFGDFRVRAGKHLEFFYVIILMMWKKNKREMSCWYHMLSNNWSKLPHQKNLTVLSVMSSK